MSASNPLYRLETLLDGIAVGANTMLVIWEGTQEPLEELFVTDSIEIIFVLGKPTVIGTRESDLMPHEYTHMVPVTIMALTSDNVYLAETEMKTYISNQRSNYMGSGDYFAVSDRPGRVNNIKVGQRVIYRTSYNVKYRES